MCEPRKRKVSNPTLTYGPELCALPTIRRVLEISTEHLDGPTSEMFNAYVWNGGYHTEATKKRIPRVSDTENGWFICLTDEPFPKDCPEELIAIRDFALRHECDWVLVHSDGPIMSGLPLYEVYVPETEAAG